MIFRQPCSRDYCKPTTVSESLEEAKTIIREAGVELSDDEAADVSGGLNAQFTEGQYKIYVYGCPNGHQFRTRNTGIIMRCPECKGPDAPFVSVVQIIDTRNTLNN